MRRQIYTSSERRPDDSTRRPNGGGPAIVSCEIVSEREKTGRSLRGFLLNLFRLLDETNIRYCVLHSWDSLPDKLPNDLDLAVSDEDKSRLLPVFEGLRANGYVPIQAVNHSVNGTFYAFCWVEGSAVKLAAVDIVSEHRRGGLTLAGAEELVANRQRHGAFWIASPQVEFPYLLAKKFFKQKISEDQARRLKFLAEHLGSQEGERLASAFLKGGSSRRAVESCRAGSVTGFLQNGRAKLWRMSLTRQPWKLVPYLAGEAWRLVGRWLRPTGVTVAIIGPDGAGKSTVAAGLTDSLAMAFWRRQRRFHWRPNVIAPKPDRGPVPDPHSKPVRGSVASMLCLSGFFLDYWAGYLLLVRHLAAKSHLVVFDRYFQDVLVDPQRYRYGGPRRFAEMLSRIIPQPDLVILVDADAESILRRKPELPYQEIERQRKAYRKLRFEGAEIAPVMTSAGIDESVCAAAAAVAEFMKTRFDDRFRGQLSSAPREPKESEVLCD